MATLSVTAVAQQKDTTANPYQREPGTIRIASYNLHACSPSGSTEANYPNVIKAIGLIDSDYMALQELDSCNSRHNDYQARILGENTDMNYIFGKTIDYRGGAYGIGMLSRKKPISTAIIQLPGKEPRAAIIAESDSLIFISTHLCVANDRNQVESFNILNRYAEEILKPKGKPILLAGDLNSTTLPDEATSHWRILSTSEGTFWSKNSRIDYVLEYTGTDKPVQLVHAVLPAYPEIELRDVSDHLPIFIDIRLPE
ncbi:MAG: endonuclease/exonuclease/phosphatase family protein [Muribaculaceae bacterium]|nr:endonuclease/exonuclease/phosphatase family protein [Muribaculaceae bacterium]